MRSFHVIASVVVILLLASNAHADSLTLVSGNAAIGESDPSVSLLGSQVTIGGITYPAAPVAPQMATVLSPNHDWIGLTGSQWVGISDGNVTAPDGGYIYRAHFSLPDTYLDPFVSLTMTSDNWSTAYLNGHLLGTIPPSMEFLYLYSFESSDPVAFLPGDNMLEFQVVNPSGPLLNPSGLLFRAEVSYTPVPEPSGLGTILVGIGGVGGIAWRRRRNSGATP